jgi:hypothetical protein
MHPSHFIWRREEEVEAEAEAVEGDPVVEEAVERVEAAEAGAAAVAAATVAAAAVVAAAVVQEPGRQ